jgi:hypothetical protein
VVTTSPIPGEIKVPVIKGVPLLTGIGEDECIKEIVDAVSKILEEKKKLLEVSA